MALGEAIFLRPSGNRHSFIPIRTVDTNLCSTLPRQVVSAPTLSRGCQQINMRNRGRASGFKVSALPDWPLMVVLVEHVEGQSDFYSYKSFWHLSDNGTKNVWFVCLRASQRKSMQVKDTLYIMFTCWGYLFFGSSPKDPFYDSEGYRKDGGDGTGNWIYEKQADMEESARAELWCEELIDEIEQKVGGLKELEEAGTK